MDLKKLQVEAHAMAKQNGFYDTKGEVNLLEKLCLFHTEISEAAEELRCGRDPQGCYFEASQPGGGLAKPCGFGIELADLIIRVADVAEFLGIDLSSMIDTKMRYNATRPHRHGKIC